MLMNGDVAPSKPLLDHIRGLFDLSVIKEPDQLWKISRLTSRYVFVIPGENFLEGNIFPDWSKRPSSGLRYIFLLQSLQGDQVRDLINSLEPLAVLGPDSTVEELDEILDLSRQDAKDSVRSRETLDKVKQQNKQLETLTQDLEALVRERTRDIEISKNQIEKKVTKVRQLVSFVKSLSAVRMIEDLLVIIRDEIKKAYGEGEAFLACDTGEYGPWILYFQRGETTTIQTKEPWNTGLKLRINDKDDQQYLANIFGRPFGRVVAFPLQSKAVDSRDVVLFVEHQLSAEQMDSFIDYMGERLQSLSLALDRSLLEVNLKRASFLWESTFDSIDDPIAIYNASHELIRSNKSFSQINEFVDSDNSFSRQLIDQCMEKRSSVSQSFRVDQRFFDVHCDPIVFHEGEKISSVVIHFVDVTNYRNLQSTMIQNEKMSAVGHLAGNIAHELNNPLTGIRSLCQVLISEQTGRDQIVDDLREVEMAASRSQKIINNLLSFSQSAAGNELKKEDLNQLLQMTLPLLKSVTSEHSRDFDLFDGELPVRVEPHLTQQVIFNLINNACQAMGEEPGHLEVKTGVEDGFACFSVKDSGPGVPGEVADGIFEPFVTTKSKTGGTGLGLSMSQRVVRSMGGEIGFESEPGKGARFWFRLPLISGEK